MRPSNKPFIGIICIALGGAGIVLGPVLGFSKLNEPWSFIVGFIFGILTGLGVSLSLFGFYEKRKKK